MQETVQESPKKEQKERPNSLDCNSNNSVLRAAMDAQCLILLATKPQWHFYQHHKPNSIVVEEKEYLAENLPEGWDNYFQTLAIPTDNE